MPSHTSFSYTETCQNKEWTVAQNYNCLFKRVVWEHFLSSPGWSHLLSHTPWTLLTPEYLQPKLPRASGKDVFKSWLVKQRSREFPMVCCIFWIDVFSHSQIQIMSKDQSFSVVGGRPHEPHMICCKTGIYHTRAPMLQLDCAARAELYLKVFECIFSTVKQTSAYNRVAPFTQFIFWLLSTYIVPPVKNFLLQIRRLD